MKTGGKQAYFATARIIDIIEDPSKLDHFYARIDDFLPFDHAVPFKEADHDYESGLQKDDDSTNKGAFGRAVRNIPDAEYDLPLASRMFSEIATANGRHRIRSRRRASDLETIRRCPMRSTASIAGSSPRSCSAPSGTEPSRRPSSRLTRTSVPSPAYS